jgi:hypothetical protein
MNETITKVVELLRAERETLTARIIEIENAIKTLEGADRYKGIFKEGTNVSYDESGRINTTPPKPSGILEIYTDGIIKDAKEARALLNAPTIQPKKRRKRITPPVHVNNPPPALPLYDRIKIWVKTLPAGTEFTSKHVQQNVGSSHSTPLYRLVGDGVIEVVRQGKAGGVPVMGIYRVKEGKSE